jgi:DNA-directed RNA polymerase specialized sigma24 family protein
MARLDGPDREILRLFLVDGAEPSAIGARLGLSAEAVRQRKCRAIRRVREEVRRRISVLRWKPRR